MQRAALFASCTLVFVTLASGGPLPASAAAATPLFAWSLPDRYGGDADGDGQLDRDGSHLPRALDVHPIRVTVAATVCRHPARTRWIADGNSTRPLLVPLGDGRCAGTINVRGEGKHRIELRADGRIDRRTVNVVDLLVVVIGDSVAAGEGIPASAPEPAWSDRRCHRSHFASGERAALRVAAAARRQGRRFGLTFVSLACSGAKIRAGLLEGFAGQEPARDDRLLEPQVDRLRRLDHANPVDAVIISVGANDVKFGPLVRACLIRKSCQNKAARLDGGPKRRISDQVNDALRGLPKGYFDLAGALRTIVAPQRVLITEYFDPTRDESGQLCRHAHIGLDAGEFAFAARSVLSPLNDAIATAAHKHRWQLVRRVPSDFRGHGYCSDDRWVVSLTESLLRSRGSAPIKRVLGTLHPNRNGQLAISARIAPQLASTLWPPVARRATSTVAIHATRVPRPIIATNAKARDSSREDTPWWHPHWIWLAIIAGVVFAWRALQVLLRRIWWVLARLFDVFLRRPGRLLLRTPSRQDMRGGRPTAAAHDARWRCFVVFLALVFTLALVLGGFAIEHVRLAAAHLPSSGASAVDRWGLEVWSRISWGIAAGALVVITGLIDPKGTPALKTRRVLTVAITVGLFVTILFLQDFSAAQERELCFAFAALVVLGHYLLHRGYMQLGSWRGFKRAAEVIKSQVTRSRIRAGLHLRTLWQLIPVALCGLSVWGAATKDTGFDRLGWIVLPVVVAALLTVNLGGLAAGARKADDKGLRPARDLLATTSVVSICVLLGRTEPWLLWTAFAAFALTVLCVVIAARSGTSFAPLAAAVAVSVLAFGGFGEALDEYRAPQARAFAALTTDQQLVCGALVSENTVDFTVGPVSLDEHSRVSEDKVSTRIHPRASLVAYETTERMPIGRALRTAIRELAATNQSIPDAAVRASACPWSPPRPRPQAGDEIARRFLPRFIVDRDDGFWPVPVSTMFALEERRGSVCLKRSDDECTRIDRASDLPWRGVKQDRVEYPARMARDDQAKITNRALGSSRSDRTSAVYYLKTEDAKSIAIQYWTFFTYDYVPVLDVPVLGAFEGGRHQGDWETVGVVASKKDGTPHYLWMSRHEPHVEGRPFVWSELGLPNGNQHPNVYVARGSHASYDTCGEQIRDQGPLGLIDEEIPCDPNRLEQLEPDDTPLVDLSRAPWACFAGTFGREQRGDLERSLKAAHLIVTAPRSPLWQQTFDHVRAEPCDDVHYRGPRDGATEEVLDSETAGQLRQGAGRLERWFDDCDDWHKAPTRGSYLVVCEPTALRAFFAGGLEEVPRDGPRIGENSVPAQATSVPAVSRDVRPGALRTWRIGGAFSHANIYAARRQGKKSTLAALFTNVTLKPGTTLRVDDRNRHWWRLIDNSAEGNPPMADAPVDVVSGR